MIDAELIVYRYWRMCGFPAHLALDLVRHEVEPCIGFERVADFVTRKSGGAAQ